MSELIGRETQQTVAEAMRLLFQTSAQDPISSWNVGICLTLKSLRTPVGEALRQQDQWPVELRPVRQGLWGVSTAVENDRQIREDEDGVLMAPLLMQATDYAAINPTTRGWRTPSGIHSLLYLYHDSELKEEIRAGCRNRITILLQVGSDPRALRSCPFDKTIQADLEMSVTQYALFTNTFDIWQDALQNLGWSRADVDDLVDEEHYLSVPALVNGEVEFRSQAANREVFLRILAAGGYGARSRKMAKNLAIYVHMPFYDIQVTIHRAFQAFQMRSTPGSWQEDGVVNLVLGVDFFLWGFVSGFQCYASFDEYDKRQE